MYVVAWLLSFNQELYYHRGLNLVSELNPSYPGEKLKVSRKLHKEMSNKTVDKLFDINESKICTIKKNLRSCNCLMT